MSDRPHELIVLSDEARARIYQAVEADLRPSKLVVHGKVGVSVLLGGLLSLFLCGQSNLALSDVAHTVNAWIVHQMGPVGCVTFCAALFAVLPAFVLRLMSSPLQFRALLKRDWVALPIWIAAFGAVMGTIDHAGNPLWGALLWTASGCLTFKAVAVVVDRTWVPTSAPELS